MDNRYRLVVDSQVTLANGGYGEWNAAQQMVDALRGEHPRTMGADKGYDTKEFVRFMRWLDVIPHVAQNINRVGGLALAGSSRRSAYDNANTEDAALWLVSSCYG